MAYRTRNSRSVVRHLIDCEGDIHGWMAAVGKRNVKRLPNGCWQVGDDPNRYPRYGNDLVHRLVFMTIKGKIPDGWHVHHQCRNRACINPEHLEAMDPSDHSAHHAELRRIE